MLTDKDVQNLKPKAKPYKVFDGDGLYVLVNPTGSRYWRYKYRLHNVENTHAIGVYPEVSLKLARARHTEAREKVERGVDPNVERKTAKISSGDTFEAVARDWLDSRKKANAFKPATLAKIEWMFADYLLPSLGRKPIATVSTAQLLAMLLKIEADGKNETAHRAKQRCAQIFRFAKAKGLVSANPVPDLQGALAPIKQKHHAALTDPNDVRELLLAIDGYQGQPATMAALKICPHVFVRPGELRAARWSEFDLDAAEWRIGPARMKMEEKHIVPLSRQVVAVLREVEPLTGDGEFVFPSMTHVGRPLSENTLTSALRRMGYTGDEMTWHGFRTLASTLLNELDYHPDSVELQLAHTPENKTRDAYNRSQRLVDRRRMMQQWSDYLDKLKATKKKSRRAA